MLMLSRRLQILVDEGRYGRLEAEAARRGVSVATVVREAIDAALPATSAERRQAGLRILGAEPMPVPDIAGLREELFDLRGRSAWSPPTA
jgi:hypothetical protein